MYKRQGIAVPIRLCTRKPQEPSFYRDLRWAAIPSLPQTTAQEPNALIYKSDLSGNEESRIVQGFRFFQKKLAGKDADDNPILASQCLQAIQQSLQVVMINLGESDDPYLIFESLNHKGKPLNQAGSYAEA